MLEMKEKTPNLFCSLLSKETLCPIWDGMTQREDWLLQWKSLQISWCFHDSSKDYVREDDLGIFNVIFC